MVNPASRLPYLRKNRVAFLKPAGMENQTHMLVRRGSGAALLLASGLAGEPLPHILDPALAGPLLIFSSAGAIAFQFLSPAGSCPALFLSKDEGNRIATRDA